MTDANPRPQEIVYSGETIEEGDLVAYPALVRSPGRKPHPPDDRDPRDWLEVRRVEGDRIVGVRVYPQDWEDGLEYHVYPLQLQENGVELVKANERG